MSCVDNWTEVANNPDIDYVNDKMSDENGAYHFSLITPYRINNILDFGCGIGRCFSYFKSIAGYVDGYDIPPMIERCKQLQNVFYANNLYDDLNDINEKYDIVVSYFVLQFFNSVEYLVDCLKKIASISYYFYFAGMASIDDEQHSDIIKVILDTNLFEVLYYSGDDNNHYHCLFKSKLNSTHRKILDINNYVTANSTHYLTKYVETFEKIPNNIPHNINAVITVSVGNDFNEIFKLTERSLHEYADRISADFIVITGKTQDWWGLEKFRIGHYAKQYNRCLFIDTDILIKPNAPNIFDIVPYNNIGIFEDMSDSSNISKKYLIQEYKAMCRFQKEDTTKYCMYNTGVIVFSNQHTNIFNVPRFPFKAHHCFEQDYIGHNINKYHHNITILPRSFNCQTWSRYFRQHEKEAYFLHFSGLIHDVRKKTILKYIEELGLHVG